jgi:predicted MPP superfamily phosphohydrolase
MGEPKPDFEGLISKLDPRKPSILLYHPPRGFEKAAEGHVGLQLSGHTHGAQIFPIRPVAQIWFPYLRGLHHLQESYLYVSRGVGTGGPPMRLGSPPEIVQIRLRSGEKNIGSKT